MAHFRNTGQIDSKATFVGELFRNEALAGDTYFIHGGLRLGSKG